MRSNVTPFPETLPSGPGPHWIDVRTLCQVLVRQITGRAAERDVRVDVSISPARVAVIGYAPVLLRALVQVVDAGLDSLPNGGTLTLTVYHDPFVIVECSTSRGAADLDHMTRSWRRSDLAAASADLTAARAIVEAHRGHLWQRTQPDGGCCTIVELPAAGPRDHYRPWRPSTGGAPKSKTG